MVSLSGAALIGCHVITIFGPITFFQPSENATCITKTVVEVGCASKADLEEAPGLYREHTPRILQ